MLLGLFWISFILAGKIVTGGDIVAKLFGTDGVRGVANAELTPELAFKLGRAGAFVLLEKINVKIEKRKIIIGWDTRMSGTMLAGALTSGICSVGVDAVLLGVVPTPCVAYLAKTTGAAAGVMISASHNPMADNGIKFFGSDGYKLSDEIELAIEEAVLGKDNMPRPTGAEVGQILVQPELVEAYVEFLQRKSRSLEGIKLVIDGANGAASFLAESLFVSLGAEVIAINCEPDGNNINAGCGSTHPEALQAAVLQHGADLGFAFDGDADRLIAVDEKGCVVDGDQIMAACAVYLKEKGRLNNNLLVVTVMSNLGLKLAMEAHGIDVLETKVGDRYVMEKMRSFDAVLGGEQSGHIIYASESTTGDGLLSGILLLQVFKYRLRPLSKVVSVMNKLPQVLKNVRVASKVGWKDNEQIALAVETAQKQLAGRGRVLVRPSGTEPLLRVMAEGPEKEELHDLVNSVEKAICEALA